MRKIEQELHEAINHFKPFSKGNTVFHRMAGTEEGWELVLHGNPIAVFDQGGKLSTFPKEISLAGYPTKTTLSRLNSLNGVSVRIKKGIPYLNGSEIKETGWWRRV